jgi:hypothetical protein
MKESMPFTVAPLPRSAIGELQELRARIDLSPTYQRQSAIWTIPKRQLFIDSLLNGFDIPKLYFHDISDAKVGPRGYRYAVVDGKQRLETIWDFLDDKLVLSDDFEFLEDPELPVGDGKYSGLPPRLQSRFDRYKLPIQIVQAEDVQWVEELFCRLNEAVALNAPERRNALGGPIPLIMRALPSRPFFAEKIPFANNRFKHLDLATKFLYLEHTDGPAPTKRKALDEFVTDFKNRNAKAEATRLEGQAVAVLSRLEKIFAKKDYLLVSLGLVVVYYLLEREKVLSSQAECRESLVEFENLRREIRAQMNTDSGVNRVRLDPELVEFERLSQSPNDSGAMTARMATLKKYVSKPTLIKTAVLALK